MKELINRAYGGVRGPGGRRRERPRGESGGTEANVRPVVARPGDDDSYRWVVVWKSARMRAPAFWYYHSKADAERAARGLREGRSGPISVHAGTGAYRTRSSVTGAASRWAEVHAAEEAGRPISHPRAFVFGDAGQQRTRGAKAGGRKRLLHPNKAHKHVRGGKLVACPHRGKFGGR